MGKDREPEGKLCKCGHKLEWHGYKGNEDCCAETEHGQFCKCVRFTPETKAKK